MRHKVVSEKKVNNSKKRIVINIACGLISITTIVCSLSPSNVKSSTSNNISYSESADINNTLDTSIITTSMMSEKVIIPEASLPVEEPIVIKLSEEPEYIDSPGNYPIWIKRLSSSSFNAKIGGSSVRNLTWFAIGY